MFRKIATSVYPLAERKISAVGRPCIEEMAKSLIKRGEINPNMSLPVTQESKQRPVIQNGNIFHPIVSSIWWESVSDQ